MTVWKREWDRALAAWRTLDRQTVVVLCFAALAVILQMQFGERSFFRRTFGTVAEEPWNGLLGWGWWFGMQGVLGFVIPVAILRFGFRRSVAEMGLGLGDWKFAGTLALAYVPLVVVGTWFLSSGDAFLAKYPHYQPAAFDVRVFLAYEALFLFYWFGWEYLWRGFVQFGTAHRLGLYAIFVQAMPFALLHYDKPLPEALLSIVGGVALGALVWRARSFWIAVPIHSAQMLILDLWSTLRLRTGVRGVGLDALWDLFRAL